MGNRRVVFVDGDWDCLEGQELIGTLNGDDPVDEVIEQGQRKAWWDTDWERLYRAAHAAR